VHIAVRVQSVRAFCSLLSDATSKWSLLTSTHESFADCADSLGIAVTAPRTVAAIKLRDRVRSIVVRSLVYQFDQSGCACPTTTESSRDRCVHKSRPRAQHGLRSLFVMTEPECAGGGSDRPTELGFGPRVNILLNRFAKTAGSRSR
jgi:hypothetical protein